MRTANLAIVFTDIKGFTERTSKQTLEQNQKLLATHNALLEPCFRGLGGRVVKTIGDAFLVTFESPTAAVLSGLALQDKLWAYNRDAPPEAQLHVRVAINVGEVRLEGNDVFGEPVNIAARVEGLAEADEVTFTEAVYLSMNRAEVAAEELGRFELKGIPESVRVFRAVRSTASPDDPPFGNRGVAKLAEAPRSTSGGSHKALELATTAADVATRALSTTSDVAARALESTSRLVQDGLSTAQQRGLPRGRLLALAGAAVVVLLLGFLLLRGNAIERAIDAAASGQGPEHARHADEARRLIRQLKDAGERAWYQGRFDEAMGDASAARNYEQAARQGQRRAEDRLIELLEHPKCPLRAAAAGSLADLQLTRARGALEDLAEDGGPDDGEQVLVFGCNSKQAAARALSRLKE